ncbi:MAG: hypothetical protein WA604_14840 [Candidatus Sulfotelmatobacter sp.]
MSNNDLTHKGEVSSQPDTDRNSSMNPNPETSRGLASGQVQEKRKAAPSGQPEPTLSEARLRANRENAKKSTGPKTSRGKASSRFNALKHGLLSKKIMFTPDGKLQDEGLLELLESLRDKYGRGDVRTELLLEGIVIEYWRNGQALEIEQACIQYVASQFTPQGCMANVLRYRTASDRALRKNLELLDELPSPSSESEQEQDEAEDNVPASQRETPRQQPQSASGSTVVAKESAPEQGLESESDAASSEDSSAADDAA